MESRVWDSPVVRKADWSQIGESLECQLSTLKLDRRDPMTIFEQRCQQKKWYFRKINCGTSESGGPREWRKAKRLFHSNSISNRFDCIKHKRIKNKSSDRRQSWLPSGWYWTGHFTSLGLSFSTYKMEIIISTSPISLDSCPVKITWNKEFPGSPVVRTQRFHCWGPGSIPAPGAKIPQAAQPKKRKTVLINSLMKKMNPNHVSSCAVNAEETEMKLKCSEKEHIITNSWALTVCSFPSVISLNLHNIPTRSVLYQTHFINEEMEAQRG